MTLHVPYEKLEPGPRSPYLAVIDYDATNERYYTPVDLDDPSVLLQGGLAPSESDPRFHQQMVYAVARETIHSFERALGRRVKWGYNRRDPLRIYPHAMQQANAYYDRSLGALLFGYFAASASDPGENLPNQTIFTCLSHDIVAHETSHAVLDGQRPYFMQDTNPDVPAFHEGFADIVALFQHFTVKEALLDTMIKTGGKIYRDQVEPLLRPSGGQATLSSELQRPNPLIGLARQFGEAMGRRSALRSALGFPPNSRALETKFEAHERGAILVAAIFDAYFSTFAKRTADLFRIARASGAVLTDDIHPDLARRLCVDAAKLAGHFATMCIRAVDYCPPVDITFGDFLRALITADSDLYPDDPYEYREAIIQAFRLRGIVPDGVASMAEDSLRWTGVPPGSASQPVVRGLQFDLMNGQTPQMQKANAILLHAFGGTYAKALHLNPDGHFVKSFHPLIRKVDGRAHVEIVTEVMQRMDIPLDEKDRSSPKVRIYGGSTVHLNPDGTVRYIIHKRAGDKERTRRLREYWDGKRGSSAMHAYVQRPDVKALDTTVNFAAVHMGV
jgi:hypothetical protein